MASISTILGNKAKNKTLNQVTFVTQMIHYSQLYKSDLQFYGCGRNRVEALADLIELAGAIQEPIVVRRIDAEKYEILSGHKRVAAAKMLVEDRNLEQYALVPVHIVKVDDYMAEYILISTNDYPEKTDYERMMEVVRLYETLPHIKPDACASARVTRRLVAKEASLCETRVGNFKNIYTHFTEKAMQAFKEQKFGINVAIKIASLDPAEQDELSEREHLTMSELSDFIAEKTSSSLETDPETAYEAFEADISSASAPILELSSKMSDSSEQIDESAEDNIIQETAKVSPIDSSITAGALYEKPVLQLNHDDRLVLDQYDVAQEIIAEATLASKNGNTPKERMRATIISEAVSAWLREHKT